MTDFERYIIARWAYSVGQPIMADAEYTRLHAAMSRMAPNSPYVKQSWSSDPCPTQLLRKYGMEELIHAVVLSDKTESIPSLNSLIEVQAEYRYMEQPHIVSMKLDGWNVQASYYNRQLINVQTRGRARDALDANVLSPLFPSTVPFDGRVLLVAELVVPDADFAWFQRTHGSTSQRGACSTAIANPNSCLEHVKVIAHGLRCSMPVDYKSRLQLLRNFGCEIPHWKKVNNYTELMQAVDEFSNFKLGYGLPTDGMVIEGPDKVRAMRIKGWEEPIYRSFVKGYEENYGPHAISVQVAIHPIKLPNSTQRVLPATNIARIMSLGLMPGAPIAFRIASSSIADIDEDATQLLQKEWYGREAEYRFMIEANEALK